MNPEALTAKPAIRLLLVDDDQVDRLACRRALSNHPDFDFVILEAETGEEGLKIARGEKLDCILLDHFLPDFKGVELLAELAEDTGGLPVPVVMLTGADNAMLAVDAIRRGAHDYVVKDTERNALQWLPAVVIRALREQQTMLEKNLAEEKLRSAEAKFRSLVEQIPAITYIATLETPGRLTYVSPQIKRLGYGPEELLEATEGWLKLVDPEDRERVVEAFKSARDTSVPLRCEYRLRDRSGRSRWFLDEANAVREVESGRPLFLQGVLVDITEDKEVEQELRYYRKRLEELVAMRTEQLEKQSQLLQAANANMDRELCERKRAETILRESEARCRLLLETVCDGIYEVDAEGCCVFVNDAALRMLGYEREELVGCNLPAKILRDENWGKAGIRPEIERRASPRRTTETFWRGDGTSFNAECLRYPIHGQGGENGAIVVFREADRAMR